MPKRDTSHAKLTTLILGKRTDQNDEKATIKHSLLRLPSPTNDPPGVVDRGTICNVKGILRLSRDDTSTGSNLRKTQWTTIGPFDGYLSHPEKPFVAWSKRWADRMEIAPDCIRQTVDERRDEAGRMIWSINYRNVPSVTRSPAFSMFLNPTPGSELFGLNLNGRPMLEDRRDEDADRSPGHELGH